MDSFNFTISWWKCRSMLVRCWLIWYRVSEWYAPFWAGVHGASIPGTLLFRSYTLRSKPIEKNSFLVTVDAFSMAPSIVPCREFLPHKPRGNSFANHALLRGKRKAALRPTIITRNILLFWSCMHPMPIEKERFFSHLYCLVIYMYAGNLPCPPIQFT